MAELHVSELFSHESQLAFKNGNWVRFILTSIAAQVTVGFLAIVSGSVYIGIGGYDALYVGIWSGITFSISAAVGMYNSMVDVESRPDDEVMVMSYLATNIMASVCGPALIVVCLVDFGLGREAYNEVATVEYISAVVGIFSGVMQGWRDV